MGLSTSREFLLFFRYFRIPQSLLVDLAFFLSLIERIDDKNLKSAATGMHFFLLHPHAWIKEKVGKQDTKREIASFIYGYF